MSKWLCLEGDANWCGKSTMWLLLLAPAKPPVFFVRGLGFCRAAPAKITFSADLQTITAGRVW
jgi:hypothetical protein